MKAVKRIVVLILSMLMILGTVVPAMAANVDATDDLKEIFGRAGFAGYCGREYYESGSEAPDEMIYYYINMTGELAAYEDENWYYSLSYDTYMEIVSRYFTNYGDMTDYFTEHFDDAYDEETGMLYWYAGGFGDVWDWQLQSVYYSNGTYYLQGLFLNQCVEDTTGLIENIDYAYSVDYDQYMYISKVIQIGVVAGSNGYLIDSYTAMDYYIIDDVLYTTDGAVYYPVTVNADHATLTFTQGVSEFDKNDTLWRDSTAALGFDVTADEAYELTGVTVTDGFGTYTANEMSFGGYHVIPEGAVSFTVAAEKIAEPGTTITTEIGASLTTEGSSSYYSTLDLIVDEIETEEGTAASNLVIESLGGNTEAIAYDIHLERNGEVLPVLDGDTVTVTLPVPEGWNAYDVVVYYVADDGTITDMMATANADGTVSFTTTHFSTYVMALKEHTHVWNDGVVTTEPTVDAAGEKTYTCDICGEEKVETIEKLTDDSADDTTTTTNTNSNVDANGVPKTGDSSGIVLWIGIMAAAFVCMTGIYTFKKRTE